MPAISWVGAEKINTFYWKFLLKSVQIPTPDAFVYFHHLAIYDKGQS
jgi:hypothetical protein